VISANTAVASKWDFGFQTFDEAKLSEMLDAAKDFIRDMATGTAPRWFSLLGRSGTGKTHLARSITRFFKAEMAILKRSSNRSISSRYPGLQGAVNHHS
jgi:chromosomal replication initiation ATPase DnaA